jgi:glycosyltransferase involved in cell wall biosynthesis
MIQLLKGKRILIQTYLFESGLFYLGKSLYKELEKKNKVLMFPKEKYKKIGRTFMPYYPQSKDEGLLDGLNFVQVHSYDRDRIIEACNKNSIDLVISLETFMPSSSWVDKLRGQGVYVIDIPMPEWVDNRALKTGGYNKFNNIWCLTEWANIIFSNYKNVVKVSWDYANDAEQFNETLKDKNIFYHPASLNPFFSQKNTEITLEAFSEFAKDFPEAKLIVSGKINEKEEEIVKKSNNIMIINEFLTKKDVYELYEKAGCLLAPSAREGLGLHFYEAKKMGCKIITTNVDPMNKHGDYLCDIISYNKSDGPIPFANISKQELIKQLKKYYEEVKNA